jgi:uncharacterized membrane protein YphA (DoxX/SURF4 family)
VTAHGPYQASHRRDLVGAEAGRMALALAVLRILVGVIWLANLLWKLPPNFGRDDPEGLLYSFHLGEDYAVIGPLRDLMHDLVIPHFTFFGWVVFLIELTAGVLLTLGVATRVGAAIGTVQALTITLLVARAPDEWVWTYVMFVALNALPLFVTSDARLSLTRRRR